MAVSRFSSRLDGVGGYHNRIPTGACHEGFLIVGLELNQSHGGNYMVVTRAYVVFTVVWGLARLSVQSLAAAGIASSC